METIAFYSYKGGVGRSLLVANAARFLGMLGKRVLALDLDIEAPGLHYKLGRSPDPDGKTLFAGGAVPYLVATARGAKNPPPLREHLVELPLPEGAGGWLGLMPAGPAPRREYWTALKQLRNRLHFDDPRGDGLAALLDLHGRIEAELKPDYLLIDSRTGVTELGGLATTALADCVVCLLVANQESVDGTLAIVEALRTSPRRPARGALRVVPVVARTTGDLASGGETGEGIKRLLKMGTGRATTDQGGLKPFVLPHDSALGVTEKVVAGERKASAFSPLHKAYLELFQCLFPLAREEAEEVLHRLEQVADLRRWLRERPHERLGLGHSSAFAPWEDSAIEEGVSVKSAQDGKTNRYADLVCRGRDREELMVAEYVPKNKEPEALEFWSERTRARCVILLCWHKEGKFTEPQIYSRSARRGERLQRTQQFRLPTPKDFEVFENPGAPSVDEALEALHGGDGDLVQEMILHWRDCMAWGHRHQRPDAHLGPLEARKILDGLAATEKPEVALRILQQVGEISCLGSELDDFDMRHNVPSLAARTSEELFAPLFWRLPVEAACRYMNEPGAPAWWPCLAAHRLLAETVMGLVYDPVQSALKDAALAGAQLPEEGGRGADEEERILDVAYVRLWHHGPLRLCQEPPPILLWDEKLREDHYPYWSGELNDIGGEALEKARKLMGEAPQLRAWLRARMSRGALVTSELLGRYDPASGRIELYTVVLDALAPLLEMQARYLKSVVFIHLSVLALAHQARDLDGQPGFGFSAASAAGPFQGESPAHVALCQYFAFRLIERLGDTNLRGAFEKLSEKQPEPYRRWRAMQHVPAEQMRAVLLRARAGEAALGLPTCGAG